MTEELPLKADLKDVPLATLLMSLHRQRATGTLTVQVNGITKKMYLRKGEAIFASSTYEDDRLGEMLVKAGKIALKQYERSVELLKKTGKRQGAILVELGYLSPKELFWGVKFQVREIIYSLFQYPQGAYEFSPGPIPQEVITLKMSMGSLIYEGLRRIEDWTRIRRELPDMETVLALSDDPMSLFQEVEFSPQDKKILSLIDGKRTIREVIEASWLNSFEATRALYVLWRLGILTEKRVEEAVPLEELFKPLRKEEQALKARVQELHQRLGQLSPYELLALEPGASLQEVKASYYRLAREFHPDRFYDSDDAELKDKLSAVFDALTDAYNAIRQELQAEEPEVPLMELEEEALAQGQAQMAQQEELATEQLSLEEAPSEEAPQEPPSPQKVAELSAQKVSVLEKAEEKFRRGLEALRKGEPQRAVEALRDATRLAPERAEFWNYLALALSKADELSSAEEALQEAIRIEPSKGDYYANLGLLYLRAKRPQDARVQFEKALALEPENDKAKRGLRQLGA